MGRGWPRPVGRDDGVAGAQEAAQLGVAAHAVQCPPIGEAARAVVGLPVLGTRVLVKAAQLTAPGRSGVRLPGYGARRNTGEATTRQPPPSAPIPV